MKEWLDEISPKTPPKGLLGMAVSYTLDQWDRLVRYLDDGRLRPDNNLAVNAIRPFVVGRKNWLFSGHPNGAKASAALYSLIETAKAFNRKVAKQKLIQNFFVFVKDVKSIFMKDVLERTKGIIQSLAPIDKVKDPLFWQKTKEGISAAIDTVDLTTQIIIREPLVAGTRMTIKGGTDIYQRSKKAFVSTSNYIRKGIKSTSSGISKGVKYSRRKLSSIIKRGK